MALSALIHSVGVGAVAAVKQAGRWVINASSLAHRITIGHLKTRKTPMTTAPDPTTARQTTIAVTGHMDLTDGSVELVRAGLRETLTRYASDELVGLSCIARGSDSLFAEELLAAGGRLVVVLPSRDYRQAKVKPDHAPVFDRLVGCADEVLVMPYEMANREAYEAANMTLLERADRVVAVWNGEPPSGKGGGTADVVLAAREAGLPVDVVWPEGAARQA